MISKFALTALLALAVCAPVQEAAAQDAVGGAIVGGVLGGVVGGALGGGRGAAVGAIVGAGTGAAIGAQGEPRPGAGTAITRTAATLQQPDGSWVGVFAALLRRPGAISPPPRYYDDTPRCMRSPTYDPRSGTFVGRDGYRRPCRVNSGRDRCAIPLDLLRVALFVDRDVGEVAVGDQDRTSSALSLRRSTQAGEVNRDRGSPDHIGVHRDEVADIDRFPKIHRGDR